MRTTIASFVIFLTIGMSTSAFGFECSSYWKYYMGGVAIRAYNIGTYEWSEGYKERCHGDPSGRCVIEDKGHTRWVFDSHPINFLLGCMKKDVDFCMSPNYNMLCEHPPQEQPEVPECGA